MTTAHTPTERLLPTDEVAGLLGITTRSLRRLRAEDPTFPTPYELNGRLLRWEASELRAWLDTKRTRTAPRPTRTTGRPARKVRA